MKTVMSLIFVTALSSSAFAKMDLRESRAACGNSSSPVGQLMHTRVIAEGCQGAGGSCQSTDDCCGSGQCANGICNSGIMCAGAGSSCTYDVECCSGSCDSHIYCN